MGALTGNAVLDCALLAWFLAQLAKVILHFLVNHTLALRLFITSGGMPSSHFSFVVACTTAIGRLYGTDGPVFALSAIVAAIVMYDACNVRRSAGDMARTLNTILAHIQEQTRAYVAQDLKEIMGHTPLQVLAGAILGFAVGFLP